MSDVPSTEEKSEAAEETSRSCCRRGRRQLEVPLDVHQTFARGEPIELVRAVGRRSVARGAHSYLLLHPSDHVSHLRQFRRHSFEPGHHSDHRDRSAHASGHGRVRHFHRRHHESSVVLSTWLFQTTNGKMPIPLAIIITLAAAVVAGCFNGFLVVKIKVDPFIATIGSARYSWASRRRSGTARQSPTTFRQVSPTSGERRSTKCRLPSSMYLFLVASSGTCLAAHRWAERYTDGSRTRSSSSFRDKRRIESHSGCSAHLLRERRWPG